MTYEVFVTPEVEAVRERTYTRYREQSPAAALRWYEAYEEATRRLESDPLTCPPAKETEVLGEGLRECYFGTNPNRPTHRLLFTMQDQQVTLVALRSHLQRDWGAGTR